MVSGAIDDRFLALPRHELADAALARASRLGAARVAAQAVEMARTSQAINSEPVELADEPTYHDATWVSAYEVNPFDVPQADVQERLREWSARLLAAAGISHVDAELLAEQENKFYADLAGTVTTQQ